MAVNKCVNDKPNIEIIKESFNSPFNDILGIEIVKIEWGRVVLELKSRKELANAMGIIHGGATATLCDVAMGMAVGSIGLYPMTVEMKINYLSPGPIDDILRAEGKVLKAGKRLVITEGEVYHKDKLLIKCIGTYSGRKRED